MLIFGCTKKIGVKSVVFTHKPHVLWTLITAIACILIAFGINWIAALGIFIITMMIEILIGINMNAIILILTTSKKEEE